jgi:hypothetical protein
MYFTDVVISSARPKQHKEMLDLKNKLARLFSQTYSRMEDVLFLEEGNHLTAYFAYKDRLHKIKFYSTKLGVEVVFNYNYDSVRYLLIQPFAEKKFISDFLTAYSIDVSSLVDSETGELLEFIPKKEVKTRFAQSDALLPHRKIYS